MKVAIIGAGPAGLAAGWELQYQGIEAEIFEAHSKPGGCASYLRRPVGAEGEKVLFDAGATVLWSLGEGEFLRKLLQKWKIDPGVYTRNSFHRFTMGEKSFELDCRNDIAWTSSLVKTFPNDKEFIEENFPRFFIISRALYKILYSVPAESFLSLRNIAQNLRFVPAILPLLPSMLRYPRSMSTLISECSPEFREWVDMFLLISLQAKSPDVDSLYGIMALCFFPLGAGSLDGGMFSLFDCLSKNFTGKLNFRTPVLQIIKDKGYLIKTADKVVGPFTHVLLGCPRWNSSDLFGSEVKLFEDEHSLDWENIKSQLWSAVVGYIAVEDSIALPEGAFNHQIKNSDGEFYFSISKRGDAIRSTDKWRMATVSVHEKLGRWEYPNYIKKKEFDDRPSYEAQKKTWADKFTSAAKNVFANQELIFVEVASPKTFHHYTRRKEGFVGGIPLTREFSFLNSPSQETLLPNVYQIGDTAFPGQSVVNCTIGALEAVRKILS